EVDRRRLARRREPGSDTRSGARGRRAAHRMPPRPGSDRFSEEDDVSARALMEDATERRTPSRPPPPLHLPERLDPGVFQLPVERMRSGYYSDKYFVRARDVLEARGRDPVVTMQVFQKKEAIVAGTDE